MEVTRTGENNIYELSLIVCLCINIPVSQSIKLGLIADYLQPFGRPLLVPKVSRNVSLHINTNPGLIKLPSLAGLSSVPLPKLPTKPPDSKSLVRRSRSPLLPLLPILPPPILLPPILPSILPPLIPKLPLLPIVPSISHPLALSPFFPPSLLRARKRPILPTNPLKIPVLGRTPLQKTLRDAKLLGAGTANAARRSALRDILKLKRKRSLKTLS